MTRKKWLFSPVLFAVFVALFLFGKGAPLEDTEKSRDVTRDRNEKETVHDVADKRSRGDVKKSDVRLRILKENLANINLGNAPPTDEALSEFLKNSGYSREEWVEISRIMMESDPYYWDKAESTLSSMLEAQEKNPDWTHTIVDQAKRTLELEAAEGTDLDGVDCRQTLCKISFVHNDASAREQYYNQSVFNSEWIANASNTYGDHKVLEDGKLLSYIYFTKKDGGEAFLEMRKRIIEEVRADSSSKEDEGV